ncbi:SMP-30/gluconolactonase/LRE family protein [Paenibacillus sp.]|uniref:SMP-30/gluconolactonase/LRE family protein n=1 Tax=Paenibacillus sp. TaxID=58172 RepID=UPI002D529866|nr:SMP-30/gluconolactonase/LRE family protein [Paenibacillus sp.]HZG58676.1 SMP-30/gluconolactonase/LRE family protein [Paenibacillus sp.]
MQALELVVDAKSQLGEGPVWHPEEQALYWVDINENRLHRYDPATGRDESRRFERMIGAAVPCADGGFVLAMQDGIYRLASFGGAEPERVAVPEGLHDGLRFNDGKCDPRGRFWAGTLSLVGTPNDGKLYCIGTDYRAETKVEQVTCSNGLAWSPDGDTMYYIDTPTRVVVAYAYDIETGRIGDGREAVRVAPEDGVPDGMAIDEEGMLWVAHWGGGQVIRYDPRSGKALERIAVPASHCTSCAFGGPNRDELYITSARVGRTPEQLEAEPLAGGLFRIRVGAKGMPTDFFGS